MSKRAGDRDSGLEVPRSPTSELDSMAREPDSPASEPDSPASELDSPADVTPDRPTGFTIDDPTVLSSRSVTNRPLGEQTIDPLDESTDTQQDTRELITFAESVAPGAFALPLPAPPDTAEHLSGPLETLADQSAAAGGGGQLPTGPTRDMSPENPLAAGVRIGRYVVLEELGAGGMGQVYAAYDPKLDRKVAIKMLLQNRGKKPRSSKARSRMAREARALAKLSHPNVVTVYDADEHADGVFIAMELVEGQSMGTWCKSRPRPSWQAVLKHYLQAARGLSAAHEAGLIHRDLKPDNVLVGDDGRVRVADFGIAALVEQDSDSVDRSSDVVIEVSEPESLSSIERLAHDNLTRTGATLGTPAYMAPEQHVGGDIGPASDQYALCAALYEGLYGVRPFAVKSGPQMLAVLLRKKRELDIERPPSGSGVPEWVRKVLLRGLAPKPSERWPSMSKLASALEKAVSSRRYTTGRHASRERRRGMVIGLVVGVLTLGAAGFFATTWLRSKTEDKSTCGRAHREIARVWGKKTRTRVQTAFVATGRAHAEVSYQRVASILDGYATEWTAMRVEACEATHVREQQSEQVLALRMHCLDRRKNHLDALVSALAEPHALTGPADGTLAPASADPSEQDSGQTGGDSSAADQQRGDGAERTEPSDILGQAVEAALNLPGVAECADVEQLNTEVPLPEDPALRARVQRLLDRVDRATVLREAGLYAEARDIAKDVLAESSDIDYPPLKARALFESAVASMRLDAAEEGEKTFRELLPVAAAAKDDALIARTWGYIIEVVGIHQGRHEDALEWVPVATMMIERAGDELVGTDVWTSISHVYRAAGKYQEALDRDRASLAIRERRYPAKHLDVAETLHNVGESLWYLGTYKEAREYHEKALAIWLETVGEDHPRTAATLSNLGTIMDSMGDIQTAVTYHRRSLTVMERMFGPDHPSITPNLNNMGVGEYNLGNPRAGLEYLHRSLAIRERTLPENHPHIALVCVNIAVVAQKAGNYDKALKYLQRAIAIQKKSLAENHPTAAWSHRNLGSLLAHLGRYDEARTHLDRAMSMFITSFGEDHEHVATTLHEVGDLQSDQGQYGRALTSHQRALAIHRRVHRQEHTLVANSLNRLGQTRWRMGDYNQARPHFDQALAMLEKTVGTEHYSYGTAANNLGRLLADMGQYDEADKYYRKALAIGKKGGLRNTSAIAQAVHNRGVLHYLTGKYRSAEKTLERAASMREEQFGDDHPDTAESWYELAWVLRDRGDEARANQLHERARKVRQSKFGTDHAVVADSLDAQGWTAGDQGDWKDAQRAHERALAIRRARGKRHPDVARSLVGLGRAALAQGQTSEARGHLQKSLNIRERVFGERHPRVADSLLGLVEVALAGRDERKARRLAERARDICQSFGHRCQWRAAFAVARATASKRRGRRKGKKLAKETAEAAGKAGNRRLEDDIERWLKRSR